MRLVVVTAAHGTQVVHGTVHIRQFLHLLVLVSLLILLISSSCLKLGLYQLLFFYNLLLLFWDSVGIWLDRPRRFKVSEGFWLKSVSKFVSHLVHPYIWRTVVGVEWIETYFHFLPTIKIWIILYKLLLSMIIF